MRHKHKQPITNFFKKKKLKKKKTNKQKKTIDIFMKCLYQNSFIKLDGFYDIRYRSNA